MAPLSLRAAYHVSGASGRLSIHFQHPPTPPPIKGRLHTEPIKYVNIASYYWSLCTQSVIGYCVIGVSACHQ